jgi:hypothetical protein
MLLDPDSFDLVQHVEAILADMSGNGQLLSIAPDDKPEPVTGGAPSSWQSLPSAGTGVHSQSRFPCKTEP